jgi:hypothetical protein
MKEDEIDWVCSRDSELRKVYTNLVGKLEGKKSVDRKVKEGKLVPLSSTAAHLGDKRYSCYSFLTSALEGGEWSASRPGRALPPRKEPPVPTVQESGWAPEPVWTQN